ncbi:TPA: hypothetical protein G5V04_003880 [Salmonella enterica]|nr:hypothetical protein [Salmonella enterica]
MDKTLNHLLNKGQVLDVAECTVTFSTPIGPMEIWIANHWHACAYVYLRNSNGKEVPKNWVRPRFRTMRRLYALIQEHAGQ